MSLSTFRWWKHRYFGFSSSRYPNLLTGCTLHVAPNSSRYDLLSQDLFRARQWLPLRGEAKSYCNFYWSVSYCSTRPLRTRKFAVILLDWMEEGRENIREWIFIVFTKQEAVCLRKKSVSAPPPWKPPGYFNASLASHSHHILREEVS